MLSGVLSMAQLDRAGPPSNSNPLTQDAGRIKAGGELFRQMCTSCHGRDGQGGQGEGQGPNLATNWEVRRAKNEDLFGFIKNGVKGTGMPAFRLPDEQIWNLAAFVRSLNAPASTVSVPGDVAVGEQLFFGKGDCSSCHIVKGRGGFLGPDLSNIGATRRLSELRNSLINPPKTPSPDYQPLMIQDSQGRQLRAIAKHETYWSAQVLDEQGAVHFYRGEAARLLAFRTQSWMPDDLAKRLSADDITNLLAFLSRLVVSPASSKPSAPVKGVVD